MGLHQCFQFLRNIIQTVGKQFVFVLKVQVEGAAYDHGLLAQFVYCDLGKRLSFQKYGLFYKWGSGWGIWFYYLAVINVGLGTFNLIPLPPLDGSNILLELFPKAGRFYSRIRKYALPLLVICLFTGILSVPLSRINSAILGGMWECVKEIWNIRLLPQGAGYI